MTHFRELNQNKMISILKDAFGCIVCKLSVKVSVQYEHTKPIDAQSKPMEFESSNLTNPTMHLIYIPQSIIQKRNVHISVWNGALSDMGHVHCGICEISLFMFVMLSSEPTQGFHSRTHDNFMTVNQLTHLPLVPHICIGDLGQH